MVGVFACTPPFTSQILGFIYGMVSIFILIYFEWRDTENQQFLLTCLNTPTEWFTTCFRSTVDRHLTRTVSCRRIREGLRKSVAEDRHLLIDRTIFHVGQPKIQAKFEHGLDQREKGKRFSWSYVAERDVPDSQISRIDWKSGIHSGLSMKYTDSSKNKTRSTDIRPWQKRFKKGLSYPIGLSRESWKQQNATNFLSTSMNF